MFNEKAEEYSTKQGKNVSVWQSPKYKQSKEKALEIIKKYSTIQEGDFWILMNETKSGKMAYTGLIISHNACLKLNDLMENKFKPECVTVNQNGFENSLVFTYMCPEQGIYEVGEVSKTNCKNAYPYAMAFKRCFDRVVLKLSKLAYDGVYSDSEADEFKEPIEEEKENLASGYTQMKKFVNDYVKLICEATGSSEKAVKEKAMRDLNVTGKTMDEITKIYHYVRNWEKEIEEHGVQSKA